MLRKRRGTPAPMPPAAGGKPDTIIGRRAEVYGDLVFSGELRVDGKVMGNISAPDQGESRLVISGEVEGNVLVPHVVVTGLVRGNISAKARVELDDGAKIEGDVHYREIEMARGCVVNGNLVAETEGKASPMLKSAALRAQLGSDD